MGYGNYIAANKIYLNQILATIKKPGMRKGEEGVRNQFKVTNLLSSSEPLK